MADFADRLRELMGERRLSGRALAALVPCDPALISRYANGRQAPSAGMAAQVDAALSAGGELAELAATVAPPPAGDLGDELAALELARAVGETGTGDAALDRLEAAVDDLATAYHRSPPAVLLTRASEHAAYVGRLLDRRTSLAAHRRLVVVGGWLSLLSATCLIDLDREPAASAHLRTAAQVARETGHREMAGWVIETRAWRVLTAGDARHAMTLSVAAQRVAPPGSSAYVQATAQEGRAWARLGARDEAYGALARTEAMAGRLPVPDRPEHHYRYDPAKAEAYIATTLSWLGDPAAEDCARQALARMEDTGRPRRAAAARLDLAFALAGTGKLDEAAGTALDAVTSGVLVPSNWWRAGEVVRAVDGQGVPEAADLDAAYRDLCRQGQ